MKTIKLFLAIIALTTGDRLTAQSIKGTILDENNQTMPLVTVALMEDSSVVSGTNTDKNGDFTFRELTPGIYNLRISFPGYKTRKVKGIEVSPNQVSYVYRSLRPDTLQVVVVTSGQWEKPIINSDFSTVTNISLNQIENCAVGKSDIISLITAVTPGIIPTDDGKDIYMRGSRRGSTAYYVDGNKVIGSIGVPGLGIGNMEVLTGGVPAEYGDCTGGLVIITTKDYKTEMRRKKIAKTAQEENKKPLPPLATSDEE